MSHTWHASFMTHSCMRLWLVHMNDNTFSYVRHDLFTIRIFRSCLQLTVARCNSLQHTAAHCNTLQHPATHCNTLCDLKSQVNWHVSFICVTKTYWYVWWHSFTPLTKDVRFKCFWFKIFGRQFFRPLFWETATSVYFHENLFEMLVISVKPWWKVTGTLVKTYLKSWQS